MLRFTFFFLSAASVLHATCAIVQTNGQPATGQDDALVDVFAKAKSCPIHVTDLQKLLEAAGRKVEPAMVANRGRHHPERPSFSFFERVSGGDLADGDFFYGHFVSKNDALAFLEQKPDDTALLVELIVWDRKKEWYNFYELIGTGGDATWFYRGDSADAIRDNAFVHRTPPQGAPKFGSHMRCSACHASGGPIQKELLGPHNDWWTKSRPALLDDKEADAEVLARLKLLIETKSFAKSVGAGIERLEKSAKYQAFRETLSLPERLRPLFCENEINIESDNTPFDDSGENVRIPSQTFFDSHFGEFVFAMNGARYRDLLRDSGLKLPENKRLDADFPWLVPVKGKSDSLAIDSLVATKLVSEKFLFDVLAVDAELPSFSAKRCALLALVPTTATEGWEKKLEGNLEQSMLAGSKDLLANLRDRERTPATYRIQAKKRAGELAAALATKEGSAAAFQRLRTVRAAVRKSEISQNPKGEILEPRFRVIFPAVGGKR